VQDRACAAPAPYGAALAAPIALSCSSRRGSGSARASAGTSAARSIRSRPTSPATTGDGSRNAACGSATTRVRLDDYVQQRIFFDGYYERPLIDWLERTLQPSDVFWDVGTNVGAVSLVASRLCRQVVSFEPDPRSLASLRANVTANRRTNIEVVPVALGEGAGTARLHQADPRNTGRTSLMDDRGSAAGAVDVTVTSADALLAGHPDWTPDVMKIDVEGAEHLVLRGAPELLASGRLRAIVFEDQCDAGGRPASREVVDRLTAAGYRIDPLGRSDQIAEDGMLNFVATLPRRS
jgi:FkbM family methyltransferase